MSEQSQITFSDAMGYIRDINSMIPEEFRHGLLVVSVRNLIAQLATATERATKAEKILTTLAAEGEFGYGGDKTGYLKWGYKTDLEQMIRSGEPKP